MTLTPNEQHKIAQTSAQPVTKLSTKFIGFKPMPTIIAVAVALIIWFLIPVPQGVKPEAWHLLALFVGTIAAIIGKAM